MDQNTEQVETFTDEQVAVQGKWTSDSHIGSVTDVATGYGIPDDELIMIKRGSVYQDINKENFGTPKVWWHGNYNYNYFAAYRFATIIASLGGDTSKITSNDVPGLTTEMYNQMKSQINTSTIGGETWEKAADGEKRNTSSSIEAIYQKPIYTAVDADKTKLRKCFLYGMATHIATDTFAHSSFTSRHKTDKITHDEAIDGIKAADYWKKVPNRYLDASKAARKTIIAYKNNVGYIPGGGSSIGDVSCFAPVKYPGARDYYIGRMATYANAAKTGSITSTDIKKWFDDINFSF